MYSFEKPTPESLDRWMRENRHRFTGEMPEASWYTGTVESIKLSPTRLAEKAISPFLSDEAVSSKPEDSSQGLVAHAVEGLSDIALFVGSTAMVTSALRAIPTPQTQVIGWGAFAISQLVQHSSKIGKMAGFLYSMASKFGESKREHKQMGIDDDTASKIAWTQAVTHTSAMAIPIVSPFRSFKSTLLSDLAIPSGIGMVERGLRSKILEDNGYPEMAKHIKAFDTHAITADVLMFAFFSAIQRPEVRRVLARTGEETIGRALSAGRETLALEEGLFASGRESVRNMISQTKEYFHFNRDTHAGVPTTPESLRTHQDVMEGVMDNITRGDPVHFDESKLNTIAEQSIPRPEREVGVKEEFITFKQEGVKAETEKPGIKGEKELPIVSRETGEAPKNAFSAIDEDAGQRLSSLEKDHPDLAREALEHVKDDIEFAQLNKNSKLQSVLVDCFIRTGGFK